MSGAGHGRGLPVEGWRFDAGWRGVCLGGMVTVVDLLARRSAW
jgi:hypothetical protein